MWLHLGNTIIAPVYDSILLDSTVIGFEMDVLSSVNPRFWHLETPGDHGGWKLGGRHF